MKRSMLQLSLGILVGGIFLLAGCASNPTAADVDAFRADVEDIFDTYATANTTGDLNLYISLWDENCVKMSPGKPAVYGKSALAEMKGKVFEKWIYLTQEVEIEEVRLAGSWGYARGTGISNTKPKGGDKQYVSDVKFLTVFKRQADGTWKILRDCYNSNVPAK